MVMKPHCVIFYAIGLDAKPSRFLPWMKTTTSCWAGLYLLMPLPLPETLLANWLLGVCGQPAQAGPLSFAARGSLKLAAGKVSGVAVDVPWGRNVPALVAIAAGEVPTLVLLPVEGASACTLRSNTAGEARDEFVYESAVPLLAVLGSVCLAVTGAEALYSDMGHVGKANIYASWPFVKAALILNYLGQGAWLLANNSNPQMLAMDIVNPCYMMLP